MGEGINNPNHVQNKGQVNKQEALMAGPDRAGLGAEECEDGGCPEVTTPSTLCVRLPPQLLEEPSEGDGGCGLYSRRSLFVGGT